MAAPFKIAVAHFRYFFVNSLTTGRELTSVVRPEARIMPFRPPASNVFGLSPDRPARQKEEREPIIVGALGTVEPRKNFLAAADIIRALGERLNRPVEFHIIGRPGWGTDHDRLATMPHVRLRGFVADAEIPEAVAKWDAALCSSHSEGLGLPLLELQYAGLPIIAPDQPIFHEVLGASGTYIRPGKPHEAAARISDLFISPNWRGHYAELGKENIARWNVLAQQDRSHSIAFLSDLCRDLAHGKRRGDTRRDATGAS
jgi:glycosyltransferase involved in cell wall biosynthesis